MKLRFNISIIFISLNFFTPLLDLSSQDYQQFIVSTLASPNMDGRGYVNDGSSKAAAFIASQYDSLQLETIHNSYFQEFKMKVNRFPAKVQLNINGRPLIPGVDYLVDPQSGSGKGTNYILKKVNIQKGKQLEKLLKNMYSLTETALVLSLPDTLSANGRMLFMQTAYLLCEQWPVLLLTDEKLTWHVSNNAFANPLFIINSSLASDKGEVSFNVDAEIKTFTEKNVIGIKKSKNPKASYFVISAHYDHLGKMGDETFFPGANDNASGVAEMLALAANLDTLELNHHMVYIAFAGEEAGLLGSQYFVENPLFPLDSIDFLLNLDLSGTGDEGITVVNATEFTNEFNLLDSLNTQLNAVSSVQKRGPAANSDHYPFFEKGVSSFFIYTRGGIKAYHDIYDKAETLPLNKAEDLLQLYKAFFLALDKKD